MSDYSKTFTLKDQAASMALGAKIGAVLCAGDIVLLRGGLGAGKTTLARGLITALCGMQDVPSPTYTLVQTYTAPDFDIWHFDLYRLERESDVWELGIEEAFENGVCLIEWPERIEDLLSGGELCIEIEITGTGRTAIITGNHSWEARLDEF